jgi:hypothetical protein
LKIQDQFLSDSGILLSTVSLPNKEISLVYKKEIIDRLTQFSPQSISIGIQEALYTKNSQKLQQQLQKFLFTSVSYYDTRNENSYHMLLLGLSAIMSDKYHITSNRESGKGRYDIQLYPKDSSMPGFLMEVKAEKNQGEGGLQALAQKALQQIARETYHTEMSQKGVSPIWKFGIAFSGKEVEIAVE